MNYFILGFIFFSVHIICLFIQKIFNIPHKNTKIYKNYFYVPVILRVISYTLFTIFLIQNTNAHLIDKYVLLLINLIMFYKTIKSHYESFSPKNKLYLVLSLSLLLIYIFAIYKLFVIVLLK